MCGIAVAIDWDGAESAVRQLVAGILHRGDVTDPVFSPRRDTAMCTRRLRIVDGEHAIQPQASPDGRLLVSFNGEIYNHAELRAELVRLGIAFKTESDTEVLAAALQTWGIEALRRLVGMYAFVAVDATNGDFLAVRDPFGVKPLYLINTGTGLSILLGNSATSFSHRNRRRDAAAARLSADTDAVLALRLGDYRIDRAVGIGPPRRPRPTS